MCSLIEIASYSKWSLCSWVKRFPLPAHCSFSWWQPVLVIFFFAEGVVNYLQSTVLVLFTVRQTFKHVITTWLNIVTKQFQTKKKKNLDFKEALWIYLLASFIKSQDAHRSRDLPLNVSYRGVSQVALAVKNPPANAGGIRDRLGRSPEGGHGNPL